VTDDHGYVPFSRSHYLVLRSSSMSYHRICNKRKTTGATSGAGTAYPSEFTSGILWGSSWYMFNFLYSVLYNIVGSFCPFYLGHCVVCPLIYDFLVFSNFPMYMVTIRLNGVRDVSTATTN
jgi:hypothetical protein